MKVKHKVSDYELNIKRFHLPICFDVKCSCGAVKTVDLEEDHLDYPIAGIEENQYWCCNECGKEHIYKTTLKVSLSIDCPELIDEDS